MSSVLPGVADVFASPLWLQSILIRLDLPTFERPMNANSGFVSLGHWLTVADDIVNSDFFMSILYVLFSFATAKILFFCVMPK